MTFIPVAIGEAVREALAEGHGKDVDIAASRPIGGGCINPAAEVELTDGSSYFLKWNEDAPPDLFGAEAAGLEALGVCGRIRIPEVIAHSSKTSETGWLLLELIERGSPSRRYGEELGAGLARLHDVSRGDEHGWEIPNYIGPLPQTNEASGSWATFWWEARLAPRLEEALEMGRLRGMEEDWAVLRDALEEWLADAEVDGHSLLHGDLWSGNVMPDAAGAPVLVDPAVYRGHREVDLAMTELFGGFGQAFHRAYEAVWPLRPGYRERRRDVYQLYPLLVHVVLFGGSYEASVRASLARLISRR
jgi:fructosamine-3-kinase